MAISTEVRRAGPFEGNGTQTDFPFSFKVFSASQVRPVISTDDGETESDLPVADFTVTLSADQDVNPGGTVHLTNALAKGTILTIISAVPYLQPVVLTNRGGFYPEILNQALDRATAQIQQIAEKQARSLAVPATSAKTPEQLTQELLSAQEDAAKYADAAQQSAQQAAQNAANAAGALEIKDELKTVVGMKGLIITNAQHVEEITTTAGGMPAIQIVASDFTGKVEYDSVHDFGVWGQPDATTTVPTGGNIETTAQNIGVVQNVSQNIDDVSKVADNSENVKVVAENIDRLTDAAETLKKVQAVVDDATAAAKTAQDASAAAKTSETNAAGSASAAASSQKAAADSQAAARTSETAAKGSEKNAAASATGAAGSASTATAQASLAKRWATQLTDPVEGSGPDALYSAKEYATRSTSGATAAAASAADAKASQDAAAKSQAAASASQTAAAGSATAAKTSETNAKSSETAAAGSATGAATSATNAKASEDKAKEYASQAAAGQLQSDWAETDETAKNFIQNLPRIDGVNTRGLSDIVHFGVCSTDAATAAKTVACPGFNLHEGGRIAVKFAKNNSAPVASTTLNVNNSGAKPIKWRGANLPYASILFPKGIVEFVYTDGAYECVGDFDRNIVYQAASTAEGEYPVIIKGNASGVSTTTNVLFDADITVNPSTGVITAPTFKGALVGNADTATIATSATSATSATKATQDASGNVLTTTYATKTEVTTGLSGKLDKTDNLAAVADKAKARANLGLGSMATANLDFGTWSA